MRKQMGRLMALATRDIVVAAACAACWRLAIGTLSDTRWSVAVQLAAALSTALLAFLIHEWGHLLGSQLVRSRVLLPSSPFASVFLFRFDVEHNSREQFVAMSLGGFAASLLALALLLWLLPSGLLATRISLGLVALGVLATFVLEIPMFWRVWRGGPLPSGAAFIGSPARGEG